MGQRPGHTRWKPRTPSAYAGPTTCLRCEAVFESWDRRQNRLCQPCHEAMAQEPSDEFTSPVPKGKRRPQPRDDG